VLTNLAVMAMWLIFPATHIVSDMIYLCLPATLVAAAVCIIFDKRPVDTSVIYAGT
jgi:SSS family solute:Na+ symporter